MLAIGCDHGGFTLKQTLIKYLDEKGIAYKDFGTYSTDSCDYPEIAAPVARAVQSGACENGVLICTTGIGMCIAANKFFGIRAALCGDPYSAEMTRRHNNANILTLGAGIIGPNLALKILEAFLQTSFDGGRHARRIGLIDTIGDCQKAVQPVENKAE